MHSVIGNLLKERQEKEKSQTVTKENIINQTIIKQTSADELKKFKELLDMGAITQEEFDAKKKQLLGL
ncbi:MAG: SHOCT domain-containing protein [Clostridia bacterium]|nr:SHOCT domain-containing protein [Clostridia bacterium]